MAAFPSSWPPVAAGRARDRGLPRPSSGPGRAPPSPPTPLGAPWATLQPPQGSGSETGHAQLGQCRRAPRALAGATQVTALSRRGAGAPHAPRFSNPRAMGTAPRPQGSRPGGLPRPGARSGRGAWRTGLESAHLPSELPEVLTLPQASAKTGWRVAEGKRPRLCRKRSARPLQQPDTAASRLRALTRPGKRLCPLSKPPASLPRQAVGFACLSSSSRLDARHSCAAGTTGRHRPGSPGSPAAPETGDREDASL